VSPPKNNYIIVLNIISAAKIRARALSERLKKAWHAGAARQLARASVADAPLRHRA
jgi:hypothetical protein